MLNLEKGESIGSAFSQLPKFLTTSVIGAAIAAALFGEGPIFILLKAASDSGLSNEVAISWLTICYLVGGLFTIIMSLYYRQPIYVAFSIPAIVLIASSLTRYPFSDVLGAIFISGILVVIIGVTGVFKKAIKYVPMPIIQGMIAGTLVSYGVAIVTSLTKSPLIVGSTIAVFLLLSMYSVISQKFPPVLGALIVGIFVVSFTGGMDTQALSFKLSSLVFIPPTFNISTIIELSIPIAILSIAFGNVQALGILSAQGYNPPTNAFVTFSGIGTIINSLFGGHNAVVAGPSIAICAGSEVGPKEGRYASTVVAGVLSILLGLIAPIAITFTKAVPVPFIDVLAGLAMVSVLANTFNKAYSSNFRIGALFAMLVGMSKITFLNIGAPFWAIIAGTLISLLLERKDYAGMLAAIKEK